MTNQTMYSTILEKQFVNMLYIQFSMVTFLFVMFIVQTGIIFYLYSKVHKINTVINDWEDVYHEFNPYFTDIEYIVKTIVENLDTK